MSELLLNIPLKTSWEVVMTEPLKSAFKEGGYSPSKDTVVSGGIEEFNKLRNQVVYKSLPKTHASLQLLYRYHDQLVALHKRLPNLWGKQLNVTLYWDDALDKGGLFGGKANVSTNSLELERLCIIFNIGALQSHLAAECRATDTDEELKNAAKLFQSAATLMNALAGAKTEGVVMTQDLKADALEALSAVMLAQAQEVFIDKAVKDKMKESIVAKLCVQAEDMFEDASNKCNKDSIKHLWDRGWTSNVAGKKQGYSALSQYFQALVAISKAQHGEAIARLDHFLKYGKKAQERIGSGKYLASFMGEAELKYKETKKDNDFIYNEIIPAFEDLSAIERVGSARLAKLGSLPESFSSHFVDIFDGAVKKGGGGEGGADGPTLKSIISTATGSFGQYLVNLAGKEGKK